MSIYIFVSLIIRSLWPSTIPPYSKMVYNKVYNGELVGAIYYENSKFLPKFNQRFKAPKIRVKEPKELVRQLKVAKYGDTIQLENDGHFDLTSYSKLVIPGGVTLIGSRGIDGSNGPLVFTNNLACNPLFVTAGDDVSIIGIRIKGPDGATVNTSELKKARNRITSAKGGKSFNETRFITYGIPNSRGIQILDRNVKVENCELLNWSYAAISIQTRGNTSIRYNFIHRNQRRGLGYGVSVQSGHANIIANLFDDNRHDIASSGEASCSYNASFNVSLPGSNKQGHNYDVHGGKDRKDGTNIAGKTFSIHSNTFVVSKNPAMLIRGKPQEESTFMKNTIIKVNEEFQPFSSIKKVYMLDRNVFIKQTNSSGNLILDNNQFYSQ